MKITITNNANDATVVTSTDEGGWAEPLPPTTPVNVDREKTGVAIVGDKPDVTENIVKGLKTVGATIKAFADRYKTKKAGGTQAPVQQPAGTDSVNVILDNHGTNAIRVLLGSGTTEKQLDPGASITVSAPGYIELRELGLVQTDPNQHEAA